MFFQKPEIDFSSGAIDAPPATLGDVYDASYRAVQLGFGTLSQQNALEEAYDRRLQSIFDATGQRLENPMRTYVAPPDGVEAAPMRDPSAQITFQTQLEALAKQFPDAAGVIAADRPVHLEARALAREAEATEQEVWDRTPGLAKYLPYIGANLAAAATDPVNVLALLPGVGEVGLGARAVIWSGVKAGAANAGAEALAQPFVQGWRAQAGLDHGIGQAAAQVTFAGLFGFAADAGVRGAYRSAKSFFGTETPGTAPGARPDARQAPLEALEAAARASPEGSTLRRAVDGDDDALAEVAKATGAIDDPAVRGAVAELERRKLFGAPPDVDRGEHASRLADAIRSSLDPELAPPGPAIHVRTVAPERAAELATDPRVGSVKTPLEGALLLRELPDVAGALPLSPHKLKQAVGLSRLSPAAFDRVAAGDVPPHFAAVIGNQVADASRHAGLVGEMAAANIKSEKAAKLFVGQALATPATPETHAVRFGAGAAERELMPERVAILERALNGIARDKRIKAVLEREAPGVKGKALVQPLSDLVLRIAETPGRVSELLQAAAAEVAGGAKPVDAARTFRERLAELLEQDGTHGLLREAGAETELGREGFGDPHGAAAAKQIADLKAAASGNEVASRFQTAKGSTYDVHGDGTTTRNKAARNDPGHEGDFGPKPRSERTVYVSSDDANLLGEFQLSDGIRRELAFTKDGKMIGVRYVEGKDAGKFERRTAVKFSEEPAEGMIPVEIWKGGQRVHFGNEITKLERAEAPAEGLKADLEEAKRTKGLGAVTKACRP
jgi:hypothetical protein